jgi:hypothetical protein
LKPRAANTAPRDTASASWVHIGYRAAGGAHGLHKKSLLHIKSCSLAVAKRTLGDTMPPDRTAVAVLCYACIMQATEAVLYQGPGVTITDNRCTFNGATYAMADVYAASYSRENATPLVIGANVVKYVCIALNFYLLIWEIVILRHWVMIIPLIVSIAIGAAARYVANESAAYVILLTIATDTLHVAKPFRTNNAEIAKQIVTAIKKAKGG